jgi:hypothetical protein
LIFEAFAAFLAILTGTGVESSEMMELFWLAGVD